MAGDRETGVEVMQMEEGLDTGPIAMAEKLTITPDMTAGEAHDRLSVLGADLIGRALAALERGALNFQPQAEEGVVYAKKIDKAEARVDFSQPAQEIHNLIRGLSPFPGAFFEMDFGKGLERVKILRTTLAEGTGKPGEILDETPRIACGVGALTLVEAQRAGRGPVSGLGIFARRPACGWRPSVCPCPCRAINSSSNMTAPIMSAGSVRPMAFPCRK